MGLVYHMCHTIFVKSYLYLGVDENDVHNSTPAESVKNHDAPISV